MNHSGMTLIGALFAVAITSMVAMGMSEMMIGQVRVQKQIAASADFQQIAQDIRATLQTKGICSNSVGLIGKFLDEDNLNSQELQNFPVLYPDGSILFSIGQPYLGWTATSSRIISATPATPCTANSGTCYFALNTEMVFTQVDSPKTRKLEQTVYVKTAQGEPNTPKEILTCAKDVESMQSGSLSAMTLTGRIVNTNIDNTSSNERCNVRFVIEYEGVEHVLHPNVKSSSYDEINSEKCHENTMKKLMSNYYNTVIDRLEEITGSRPMFVANGGTTTRFVEETSDGTPFLNADHPQTNDAYTFDGRAPFASKAGYYGHADLNILQQIRAESESLEGGWCFSIQPALDYGPFCGGPNEPPCPQVGYQVECFDPGLFSIHIVSIEDLT